MKRSRFGAKFTRESGILRLMDDLGEAASADAPVLALGGGNPARIPEVESIFRKRVRTALDSGDELERLIGSYDAPRGNREVIEALARLLRNQFGWKLADSIAFWRLSSSLPLMRAGAASSVKSSKSGPSELAT